jgi:hypothetical protein
MNRRIILLAVVIVCTALALAGGLGLTNVTASSNGSTITVRWSSGDETGVVGYAVERRALSSTLWVPLVQPYQVAAGNDHEYSFEDKTAFRVTDNVYYYQITQVYADGHKGDPYRTVVSHNVSGIRRTWGSIKAMFR